MARMQEKVSKASIEVVDILTEAGLYNTKARQKAEYTKWVYDDPDQRIMIHTYLTKGGLVEFRVSHTTPGQAGALFLFFIRDSAEERAFWLKSTLDWIKQKAAKTKPVPGSSSPHPAGNPRQRRRSEGAA